MLELIYGLMGHALKSLQIPFCCVQYPMLLGSEAKNAVLDINACLYNHFTRHSWDIPNRFSDLFHA
jgi:hypothetical protein